MTDKRIYETDYGHVVCWDHAGMTMQTTGRTLAGRKPHRLTARDMFELRKIMAEVGIPSDAPLCETCRARDAAAQKRS